MDCIIIFHICKKAFECGFLIIINTYNDIKEKIKKSKMQKRKND